MYFTYNLCRKIKHIISKCFVSFSILVICIPAYEYAILESRVGRRNNGFTRNNFLCSKRRSISIVKAHKCCRENLDREISSLVIFIISILIRSRYEKSCSIKEMTICSERTGKLVYINISIRTFASPSGCVTSSRNFGIALHSETRICVYTIATTGASSVTSNSNYFTTCEIKAICINSNVITSYRCTRILYMERIRTSDGTTFNNEIAFDINSIKGNVSTRASTADN